MVYALEAGDPRQAGKYQLVGRLGRGGMGQVFLGRSPGGRTVAVKLIRAELAGDPGFRARFAREVATARTVSGIFTVPVVDADVEGPQPWLVTAFVDGPSLADEVASRGPLPAGTALTLAAGLAEGLEAIHAAGVVHRDLKPSNVLLAADGPRIIDFGISHTADGSGLTRTGWVAGSPGFMSPEQAEGVPAGPASDIFSLGSVLVFAVTGREPFGTGTAAAVLYRVVHRRPDTSRVPASLRPLVEHCLEKDPRHRPTAGEIVAAIGSASPAAGGRRGLGPAWVAVVAVAAVISAVALTVSLHRSAAAQPVPAGGTNPAASSRPAASGASATSGQPAASGSGRAAAAPSARVGASPPPGFNRYTDPRFGFTVLWPAAFSARPSPADSDGRTWISPDGQAQISVYGANNTLGYSPAQDEAADASGLSVTYRNVSGNVVTVSGFKDNGRTIFYQRDVVGPGAIDTLYWSYPADQKARWDAQVTQTALTFRPGNVSSGH